MLSHTSSHTTSHHSAPVDSSDLDIPHHLHRGNQSRFHSQDNNLVSPWSLSPFVCPLVHCLTKYLASHSPLFYSPNPSFQQFNFFSYTPFFPHHQTSHESNQSRWLSPEPRSGRLALPLNELPRTQRASYTPISNLRTHMCNTSFQIIFHLYFLTDILQPLWRNIYYITASTLRLTPIKSRLNGYALRQHWPVFLHVYSVSVSSAKRSILFALPESPGQN